MMQTQQVVQQAADVARVAQETARVAPFGIRLEGWLTIVAILLGPIIALWLQRMSERRREQGARKLTIFKELMATRAAKVSPRHVDALNAIEIEFSSGGGSDKSVADAWRLYLDHLNDPTVDANNADALARWADKGNDLLVSLLYEMSQALKFGFDKVSLRKGVYSPRAHGELEAEQILLRRFLLELMDGKRAMWTGIFTGDRPVQMQVVPPPTPAAVTIDVSTLPPPATPPADAPGEPHGGH